VATLTAAIQELKAEFDAYKATHPWLHKNMPNNYLTALMVI
jgi:hypothetical protein